MMNSVIDRYEKIKKNSESRLQDNLELREVYREQMMPKKKPKPKPKGY